MKMGCLILLLAPLVPVQSVQGSNLVHGDLGAELGYLIDSSSILRVGDNASIFLGFYYNGPNKMHLKSLWVTIWGAGINSSEYGISKQLAKDIELRTSDSFNETIAVKPLREGTIACLINTEYNWTDLYGNPRDGWGTVTAYMEAKTNTYNELLASENTFRILTYTLSITTIAFIGSTVYISRRKPKEKQSTP